MKIAIDCRLIGQSGIGTFIENVVHHMVKVSDAEFVLIGNKDILSKYNKQDNCTIVECNYGSFTLNELLRFPTHEVNKCNVFYTPNFNIPMGIRIPVYATIHDIVFFDTENFASSLYKAALRWYIQRALRIAHGLFTVSNFSRERIQSYFHTSRKITVVPNGLSKEIIDYHQSHPVIQHRSGIVYLGNIKKHKGIHVLLKAYTQLIKEECDVPKLTIIGRSDSRTKDDSILQVIDSHNDNILLVSNATNQQVYDILSKAACLVSPSLYEGFGIPTLEAMSLGTPVILSDIPAYKEIYGNFPVTFFEAGNAEDLYDKLKELPSSPINTDSQIGSTYSYEKTAKIIMQELAGIVPDNE